MLHDELTVQMTVWAGEGGKLAKTYCEKSTCLKVDIRIFIAVTRWSVRIPTFVNYWSKLWSEFNHDQLMDWTESGIKVYKSS